MAGFDPDPDYVRNARTLIAGEGCEARVVDSRPSEVPDGIGSHDAAILGWGAYTHIVGREARVSFLAKVGRKLPIGAPLLLSCWERQPRSRALALTHRVARVAGKLAGNPRLPELGDSLKQTFVHYFVEDEVRDELAAAGYEMLAYASDPYAHAVAVLSKHAA